MSTDIVRAHHEGGGGEKTFSSLIGPINAAKIETNVENILRLKMEGVLGRFSLQGILWLWIM